MKREPRFLLWICRKCGLDLPSDSADRSFALNWVLHGTHFGVGWGVGMALLEPVLNTERNAGTLLLIATLAAVVYGLMMALARRRP
ncbi:MULTISPECIES: DUF6404 family protein [unclassified Stenotrophomonas]|uniref:DUF6404 family protein n=1 Tax=unclassified Stenotrophomonas TaxID=196198 RepID=UPI0013106622|nr:MULTISPECIES: DUF6404 family protein [unclassified Stenotrophomonas]